MEGIFGGADRKEVGTVSEGLRQRYVAWKQAKQDLKTRMDARMAELQAQFDAEFKAEHDDIMNQKRQLWDAAYDELGVTDREAKHQIDPITGLVTVEVTGCACGKCGKEEQKRHVGKVSEALLQEYKAWGQEVDETAEAHEAAHKNVDAEFEAKQQALNDRKQALWARIEAELNLDSDYEPGYNIDQETGDIYAYEA